MAHQAQQDFCREVKQRFPKFFTNTRALLARKDTAGLESLGTFSTVFKTVPMERGKLNHDRES